MPTSDRRIVVALLLALAACHREPASGPTRNGTAPAATTAAEPDRIACANGGAALAPDCTVELDRGVITLRNPDGAFHRLHLQPGTGVIAADGAAPARVMPVDAGTIEVAIGGDRYRLPATVKGR